MTGWFGVPWGTQWFGNLNLLNPHVFGIFWHHPEALVLVLRDEEEDEGESNGHLEALHWPQVNSLKVPVSHNEEEQQEM